MHYYIIDNSAIVSPIDVRGSDIAHEYVENPDEHERQSDFVAASKKVKIAESDTRTQSEILAGFEHDGYTFSMSVEAQHNWQGLRGLLRDNPQAVEGLKIPATQNGVKAGYTITQENCQAFLSAGFQHKQVAIQQGIARAEEINALTTVYDVMAYEVVDGG